MPNLRAGAPSYPVTTEVRWRHRFSILTVLTTVALVGWGGFVTSIDAGLAVPDWPSSFNSYDPFNPWPDWWLITPVLAEHGHRLLGALVGLFTLTLAVWTWRADPRAWMRRLGFGLLALVIFQGVLGGLRVVWVSLDLAVVHACVAQLFFSTLAAATLFTSPAWLRASAIPAETEGTPKLRRLAVLTAGALYVQIILGALLRHPGTGIDPVMAGTHMLGAFVVAGLIVHAVVYIRLRYGGSPLLRRAANALGALLVLQVTLGFTAFFVLLDERGILRPSNLQVIVNTTHLVIGALLMATAVLIVLLALRRPAPAQARAPEHSAAAAPAA